MERIEMSARAQSVSRARELVRIAKATPGWDVREGPKRAVFVAPNGTEIALPVAPGERILKQVEANLSGLGLPEKAPSAPAHRQNGNGRNAAMVRRFNAMTVLDRAKTVWSAIRTLAAQENCETVTIDGIVFWKWTRLPLAYFIKQEFGSIPFEDKTNVEHGGSRPIYDFLRSTANAVRFSTQAQSATQTTKESGYWLIRDEWNEAGTTVVFRTVTRREPDAIDRRAARLTPHEAGEDREPFPVTVRNANDKPVEPTPVVPEEQAPAPADETLVGHEDYASLRDADGMYRCPECKAQKKKFTSPNPQGLSAHRKARHGVSGTTYRPSVVTRIAADSRLADIGVAFEMLRQEVQAVVDEAAGTGEVDGLRAEVEGLRAEVEAEREQKARAGRDANKAYQERDAAIRQRDAFKAEKEHQRRRAEAAESVLHTIRHAIETMPMAKAFAAIAEAIPQDQR